MSDTSGGAFLTCQRALDTCAAIDFGGFTVVIQIGDGTYTDRATVGVYTGQASSGDLVIQGNTGTPANVVISTSGTAITISAGARATVRNLKVQTTTSGHGLRSLGALSYSNIIFGACANKHISAENNGIAQASGPSAIVGGAQSHWGAGNAGIIADGGQTITLTGTIAFSVGFIWMDGTSAAQVNSNTFTGTYTATGARYVVGMNSIVQTFGGGASYLPGDAVGTTSTGGQYA